MSKKKKAQKIKPPLKVLYATSEAYPLVKTGGLGDVSYALPKALKEKGVDIRLVLPAYRQVLAQVGPVEFLTWLSLPISQGRRNVRILRGQMPGVKIPLYLVDIPELFDREGNPYLTPEGYDWPDNAERFTLFSRAVVEIAKNRVGEDWLAEVVHASDWQTGLVPAFLSEEPHPPKRIFTIHNMAYGGYFDRATFDALHLPWHWWTPEGVEFYGSWSMMKAGIVYADWVNTVSPTYAKEITTEEFGYGFAPLLKANGYKLRGILNGIDTEVWNPATDPYLVKNYSVKKGYIKSKKENKTALLNRFALDKSEAMLVGFVGRLVAQKGIDLVIETLPKMLKETSASFIFVGTGDVYFEKALEDLARRYPNRLGIFIGYSEALAHLVEAGSDVFLMPSRFEPCGLNQMYSLHYGTLPLVHHTGGLADTVVNATEENIQNKRAQGFVFYEMTPHALLSTLHHALYLFDKKKTWQQMQKTAMETPVDWHKPAEAYLQLYLTEPKRNDE